MPAATQPWVWRTERAQHRHPMTVQLFQAAPIELHATGAGAEPYAGARLSKRLSVTSFRLWVVPDSNVLKLKVQDSVDSNRLPIEAGQLIQRFIDGQRT